MKSEMQYLMCRLRKKKKLQNTYSYYCYIGRSFIWHTELVKEKKKKKLSVWHSNHL